MRIAVSGTHRIGKTTLVEEFARAHPGFEVEPEPYEQLLEAGEDFLDHFDPDAFVMQLEHLVSRLSRRTAGEKVIFDRSPFDFLAYVAASEERRLNSFSVNPDLVGLAVEGLNHLDLIAWLPLESSAEGTARRSFRRLVDSHLGDMISSDALGILSGRESPRILDLRGPASKRLAGLTAGLDQQTTFAGRKI